MSSIEAPNTPFSANTTRAASRIRWRVASRRAERGSSTTIVTPLLSIHPCTQYIDVSDTRLYRTTHGGGTQLLRVTSRHPIQHPHTSGRASHARPAEACPVFERLGSWTYRFRFLIVVAWVIAGVFM